MTVAPGGETSSGGPGSGPEIVLVAAVAENGVIGAGGGMPWHLPGDLAHFKEITWGHVLVMGRRTFEAIGRPLPGRRTVVVTRTPGWSAPGVEVAGSLDEAITLAGDGPVMVVGGGEIYAQAMPRADRLEISHVLREVSGDTVFPPIDPGRWRQVSRTPKEGFEAATYLRR